MTNVVVFSGGRGATTIVSALARTSGARLSVVVNAYDAGLSTGRVRRAVRGLLGPSDIRKMAGTLARAAVGRRSALAGALEVRLSHGTPGTGTEGRDMASTDAAGPDAAGPDAAGPDAAGPDAAGPDAAGTDAGERRARAEYQAIIDGRFDDLDEDTLVRVGSLSVEEWLSVRELLLAFQRHVLCTGDRFSYQDLALGNAVLAGLYLVSDFNDAVHRYQDLLRLGSQRVFNVSCGEDLWLSATAGDHVCPDEGTLVTTPPPAPITDLHLLLRDARERVLGRGTQWTADPALGAALRHAEVLPDLNPQVAEAVAAADIIVYGPGTQHSSLFPTYLTRGLGEAVRDNRMAEKVLITNLERDKDQHPKETVADLLRKFMFFMSRRGTVALDDTDVISTVLLSDDDCHPLADLLGASIRRRPAVWAGPEGGHLGRAVRDEISSAAGRVTRRRSSFCAEASAREGFLHRLDNDANAWPLDDRLSNHNR